MTKYVKKPVVVEAWQFGSGEEMPNWIHAAFDTGVVRCSANSDYLLIKTLEGVMQANKGDYIIQGVDGELYPCKPDIFKKTYDCYISF